LFFDLYFIGTVNGFVRGRIAGASRTSRVGGLAESAPGPFGLSETNETNELNASALHSPNPSFKMQYYRQPSYGQESGGSRRYDGHVASTDYQHEGDDFNFPTYCDS
jgi:hypothetical protein